MFIYKIIPHSDLIFCDERTITDDATQIFHGSELDRQDGFYHFSNAAQLSSTLELYFKDQPDLSLLRLEAHDYPHAIRWEKSRHGEIYPHFYGVLTYKDLNWLYPINFDTHQQKHFLPAL